MDICTICILLMVFFYWKNMPSNVESKFQGLILLIFYYMAIPAQVLTNC